MGNNTSSENHRKYKDFYISGERLGAGTYATVKRSIRKADKKEFAVKIIDKSHLTGRELVGLKEEIKILKTIEHPNIVKLYDVFDNNRKVKMILELCEGGNLFDQIWKSTNHRFDEKKAARTTIIIARALEYLHEHFVVHRDLKPENILFTKDDILKVTDFGLAHHLRLPPEAHVMHTCCGTPHYVAPEVLADNQYSVQTDFWSLGVILYIMLSGYQPFNSHSIHAMYGMIIRGQYCFPAPYWDHVSEIAKDCIRSLMCVDPKKRLNCEGLLKHEFIKKNVDLKEILQQEKLALVHQKELLTSSADYNDLEVKPLSHNDNLQQKKPLSNTSSNLENT